MIEYTDFFSKLGKMRDALEEYDLALKDFQIALRYLQKLVPDVERKEDNYGNEYYECPDCCKKFTYRHFDGYCEKCGKRLIW